MTILMTRYYRLNQKLHNTIANIWFNKQCITLNVIPKFAQINMRTNTLAAEKTKRHAQLNYLKNEIRSLYTKKALTNKRLITCHLELTEYIPIAPPMEFIDKFREEVIHITKKKYERLNKKLNRLTGKDTTHIPEPNDTPKFNDRGLCEVYSKPYTDK